MGSFSSLEPYRLVSNYGEEAYKMEFYPYKRGGGAQKGLAMLKGVPQALK